MPGPHGGSIKVRDVCSLCEQATDTLCRMCQRPMCSDHLTEDSDVCVECGEERVEVE